MCVGWGWVGGWENFEPFLQPKMLLTWCVHSACDPTFGQRPTINSLYVQLWLRTYMCSTTKSKLHLTWLEVWWSLGSYQSMFHHAMRGDTLSHSIESIYDLWWSFGLTHPCSTTLWAPDHSTSIIMRQCKDKGHISHPQEKPQSTSTGGRGGRGSRWVHYIGGGWGGGLPNLDHVSYSISKLSSSLSTNQNFQTTHLTIHLGKWTFWTKKAMEVCFFWWFSFSPKADF